MVFAIAGVEHHWLHHICTAPNMIVLCSIGDLQTGIWPKERRKLTRKHTGG